MEKATLSNMQNSYIVKKGDATHHFLKTNPRAEKLAKHKLEELNLPSEVLSKEDLRALWKGDVGGD